MLYTRLFVRKRSVFSTKVVFFIDRVHVLSWYISTWCNHSLHLFSLPPRTLHSLCLWIPIVKVLHLFLFVCVTGCEDRLPCQWATEECMHLQLMSIWTLHFPFTSRSSRLTFVCLIILTFTASSSDVGDQDIHHLKWHSQSTRLRVWRGGGGGLPGHLKGNGLA